MQRVGRQGKDGSGMRWARAGAAQSGASKEEDMDDSLDVEFL